MILILLLVQAVTFIGLIFFLKKVLYSQFQKSIRQLDVLRQENEKKRTQLQNQIAENEKQLKERQKQIEDQAKEMFQKAEKEIEELRARSLVEAQTEAERVLQEVREKEKRLEQEFELKLTERAGALAGDAMRFVFKRYAKKGIHEELLQSLLSELTSVEEKRFHFDGSQVEIVSAFELEADQRRKFQEVLEKRAGRKLKITDRVDPVLIGGVILNVGHAVLDGSLKTRLKEAVGTVRKGEKGIET